MVGSIDNLRNAAHRVSEEQRVMIISMIPIQKYTKEEHGDMDSCSICIGDMENRIKVLGCKHGFHEDCIDSWILKSRDNNIVCPVCRTNIKEKLGMEDESDQNNEDHPNEIE